MAERRYYDFGYILEGIEELSHDVAAVRVPVVQEWSMDQRGVARVTRLFAFPANSFSFEIPNIPDVLRRFVPLVTVLSDHPDIKSPVKMGARAQRILSYYNGIEPMGVMKPDEEGGGFRLEY